MITSHGFRCIHRIPRLCIKCKFKVTRDVVIRNIAMKRNHLPALFIITIFVIISYISCNQIPKQNFDTSSFLRDNYVREKRQLENFDSDDDYATPTAQGGGEEPGFWDRVVKVALRLFNRFIEWLNS